jgi:ribokinase
MTKSFDVAVVGELFTDHIFTGFAQWPQPGEEVFSTGYVREIGGGAAITACALARLGRSVASIGIVGKSDEWSRSRLESFGVAVDGLMTSETLDTAVTVSISTSEDRSFFTWAGANAELPEMLSRPEVHKMLCASRQVHFAMRLERRVASALLPLLREARCSISIDPGYHPEWYRASENQQTLREFDYFFPNSKEGHLITGCEEPQQIIQNLQQSRIHGTILKLGRRGAVAALDGRLLQALPPEIQGIDTTGAGDAFDAGFIDSILDDPSLERALRRGCVCGALSTRSAGALGALPTIKELEDFYEQVRIEASHAE